jgi:hypothetical protein
VVPADEHGECCETETQNPLTAHGRHAEKSPTEAGLTAATSALAVLLDWRARHGAVGAEYAAIASQGLQPSAAALAVIEELAGIRWHRFDGFVAAGRAGQGRFKLHADKADRSASRTNQIRPLHISN